MSSSYLLASFLGERRGGAAIRVIKFKMLISATVISCVLNWKIMMGSVIGYTRANRMNTSKTQALWIGRLLSQVLSDSPS